jgi:hypothetical protein
MLGLPGGRCAWAAVFLAGVALLTAATPCWAVSVTTSTYATQSDPPTVTAQTPLATKTSLTSVSASVRSDENSATTNAAHAQAWASAQVTSSGVVKSASGKGWLDSTTPTVKSETWSSSASGSMYEVSGSAGQSVPFQFQAGIPTGSLTIFDTGLDPQQNLASDFPLNVLQLKRSAVPDNPVFDLFFSLNVAVTQNGVTQPIFGGHATFAANGAITLSGDDPQSQSFFPQFLSIDQASADGSLAAHFNPIAFPRIVQVVPNIPFELTFIETMKMGDGVSTSATDFSGLSAAQSGGGGSFTGTFELQNPNPQNILQPAITPGDFNLDGQVNVADVSAMLTAMSDVTAFKGSVSDSDFTMLGNFDTDSIVTNKDVEGLIVSLANSTGGGSLSAVPEPSTWALFTLGGLAIAASARRRTARRKLDS